MNYKNHFVLFAIIAMVTGMVVADDTDKHIDIGADDIVLTADNDTGQLVPVDVDVDMAVVDSGDGLYLSSRETSGKISGNNVSDWFWIE